MLERHVGAEEVGAGLKRHSSGLAGTLDIPDDLPFNGGERPGQRGKRSLIHSLIYLFIQQTYRAPAVPGAGQTPLNTAKSLPWEAEL